MRTGIFVHVDFSGSFDSGGIGGVSASTDFSRTFRSETFRLKHFGGERREMVRKDEKVATQGLTRCTEPAVALVLVDQ